MRQVEAALGFNEASRYLPAAGSETLILDNVSGDRLAVAHAWSTAGGAGLTAEHPLEDAFMLSLQLRDYEGKIWVDGRSHPDLRHRTGYVAAYDYRRQWRADLVLPFDCLNYHLPRRALNVLLEQEGLGTLTSLRLGPDNVLRDDVIMGLTQALRPALSNPQDATTLFTSHVGHAVALHVARTYGDIRLRATGQGMLATWQERRAKEMIEANLNGDFSITEIASECGLSPSYFIRAFRRTTGCPPYRWLLRRRIERAKILLLDSRNSIAGVAAMLGFSDQSHLSRLFTRVVGVPPASWRRSNIN